MSGQASASAEGQKSGELGETQFLSDFELDRERLTTAEIEKIATMGRNLLEQCYVHLGLKRAIYGADPVELLRALLIRIASARYHRDYFTEREFHDEMTTIFTSLRDLHTVYYRPEPYRSRIAFLPFLIEEFYEDEQPRFIVSKVHELAWEGSSGDEGFERGVEVTHWNGMPIERAVELNARRRAGSNRFARRARGIEALTFRWLAKTGEPDEHDVRIKYLVDGKPCTRVFPWRLVKRPGGRQRGEPAATNALVLGIDNEAEWISDVKRALFAATPPPEEAQASRLLPGYLRFGDVPTEKGPVGHLRLFSFDIADHRVFLGAVQDVIATHPEWRGLILDVRGNGGGNIVAAEIILQLFTDRTIEPEPLRFRNSDWIAHFFENRDFMADDPRKEELRQSIAVGRYTGAPFSRGFPIYPAESYNEVGRVFTHPVVLIVDSLCYSATDVFAAGFQDHEIGRVLGLSGRTGAGGANVWDDAAVFRAFTGRPRNPDEELPYGASFDVAVRRLSRVGQRLEDPLEDLGVLPDVFHSPTRKDLLDGNADLLAQAVALIDAVAAAPAEPRPAAA